MNKEKIKVNNNSFLVIKPNTCSICKCGIDPKTINKFIYKYNDINRIIVTYQCPICDDLIFAFYEIGSDSYYETINDEILHPFRVIGNNQTKNFSDEIKEVSKRFVDIYNDTYIAEQAGCKEIIGVGYRRAFEFLIKDFAIKYNPNDAEKISNMTLSQCVNCYSPDEETKQLLLKASWIGNDFAHYKNKHKDIKLDDLKQLIMLSLGSIESYIKKKNYICNIEKSIRKYAFNQISILHLGKSNPNGFISSDGLSQVAFYKISCNIMIQ